jgi:hypothetical protein
MKQKVIDLPLVGFDLDEKPTFLSLRRAVVQMFCLFLEPDQVTEDPSARQEAESARQHAHESAEAAGEFDREPSAPDFEPTEELKSLYRQAAKELHPDLTTDDEEKQRRMRAMSGLNKAYEECDAKRIRQILDEWHSSPEHVQGDATAAQLVRVIREIAQVRKRLDAIAVEIKELAQTELSRLMKQVREAATHGQDLLAQMAQQLDDRIGQAKTRLDDSLKSGTGK